ncbi:MAG: flavodoxin domain-containing protein [Candidatus Methanoperedens sp.]|nr:flavodoxin domain-containing protein [Candidatus Methanoperedens sp.]
MANNKKILITYASGTGSTEKLAQVIAEGMRKVKGIEVDVKRARNVKPDDAVSFNGYAIGSHSATEYMEGEIKNLFEELYQRKEKVSGKPLLLFTTGQGRQAAALASLEKLADVLNPQFIKPGLAVKGMPGEADKANALEMGEKLADAVHKLKSNYIVA